jgi:hypothetical protein
MLLRKNKELIVARVTLGVRVVGAGGVGQKQAA